MEHYQRMESTLTVAMRPEDMLKHNEEHGGILYKYDLPVENLPITFKSQLMVKDEIPNTPTENLLDQL